jgi:hypothetical protein
MLASAMETADVQEKLAMMENRVKRLLFEENRAEKLNRVAREKAANMIMARERHNSEFQDKLMFYQLKYRNLENQRNLNNERKE